MVPEAFQKRKDFVPFNFMDSGFNERKLGRKSSFFFFLSLSLSFCEDKKEKKERKREEG